MPSSLTPSFETLFYNSATHRHIKPRQSLSEYCYDLEVHQGKNVAKAATTAEGTDCYCFTALCDMKKSLKGTCTWVYHFDTKLKAVYYISVTRPELATKTSIVRIGAYTSNLKHSTEVHKHLYVQTMRLLTMKSKSMAPSLFFSNVGRGERPIPHIGTKKDAGYVVRAGL